MKFQEYVAKQLIGEAFYNLLERIAFALEVIAKIKTIEQTQYTTEITVPEYTMEDAFNDEQKENRQTISEKMLKNESKAMWAEENLTPDELENL